MSQHSVGGRAFACLVVGILLGSSTATAQTGLPGAPSAPDHETLDLLMPEFVGASSTTNAVTARVVVDAKLQGLIDDLLSRSPAFRRQWQRLDRFPRLSIRIELVHANQIGGDAHAATTISVLHDGSVPRRWRFPAAGASRSWSPTRWNTSWNGSTGSAPPASMRWVITRCGAHPAPSRPHGPCSSANWWPSKSSHGEERACAPSSPSLPSSLVSALMPELPGRYVVVPTSVPPTAALAVPAVVVGDGASVAFEAHVSLDPTDQNGKPDVYLLERATNRVTLVSRNPAGNEARLEPVPRVSRVTASGSCSNRTRTDLVRRPAWQNERVRLRSGAEGAAPDRSDERRGRASALVPALSADGRVIVFHARPVDATPDQRSHVYRATLNMRGESRTSAKDTARR